MASNATGSPTDVFNPVTPYPIWENGGRFDIYSAVQIDDKAAKSLPWPAELMRRIQNFTFEDSEHVSRVHLTLINSDFM